MILNAKPILLLDLLCILLVLAFAYQIWKSKWVDNQITIKHPESYPPNSLTYNLFVFVCFSLYMNFIISTASHHTAPTLCNECTSFPEYLFDHIIRRSKLFLVQIQLEMADLQNHYGSRGSRYVKRIS